MTFIVTYSYVPKIPSTTCVVKVVSFSSVSCIACFTFPYATANSPITLSDSSCSSPNHYWRIFYWSCIFLISSYDYLCAKMVVIHSTCGRVFMLFESFCVFPYASHNLASMTFILWILHQVVHICALSLKIFMHSSSSFLIFSTTVIVVLSLPALSSSGVPDILRDCNSSILVWKPLMVSLILET
jgi:hypothetical protein